MPAPSPLGLKSSIEYFAMSVDIGRTLYGPRSLLVLLRQGYENIEPVTILKTGAASKAPYTRLLPQDLLYMTRSRNPLALFFYCLANISFII